MAGVLKARILKAGVLKAGIELRSSDLAVFVSKLRKRAWRCTRKSFATIRLNTGLPKSPAKGPSF
jgi:hypothetical protein